MLLNIWATSKKRVYKQSSELSGSCQIGIKFKYLCYCATYRTEYFSVLFTYLNTFIFLGMGSTVGSKGQGALRRDAFKNSGHSKSFGASKAGANGLSENGEKFQIKPKIIAILRSGLKPRKAVRVLLNNRNTKSFDTLLADLTNTVKLDTGAVRKMFTLDGRAVMALQDFTDAEVFIAYGVDKCTNDDFDLDIIEFR